MRAASTLEERGTKVLVQEFLASAAAQKGIIPDPKEVLQEAKIICDAVGIRTTQLWGHIPAGQLATFQRLFDEALKRLCDRKQAAA